MKPSKDSFLFFYLTLLCSILTSNTTINAQKAADSLSYYYGLVTNPKKSNDLISAYQFYKTYKENCLKQKDTLNAIQGLRFIASIQKNLGALYDSEASAIEALKLLDHSKIDKNSTESKFGLYNHLGIIYKTFYDYDKALELYSKALKIAQITRDSVLIFNNKANVHIEEEKFELAIKELLKAYRISIKLNDQLHTARALDNLGFAQSQLNLPEALPNMIKALHIRTEQDNRKGVYTSYSHLTDYYRRTKNIENATLYANKGYALAKLINSPRYIEDALSNIISLSDNSKIIEYKNLKDSLANAKVTNRNLFNYSKYQYNKKEKELLQNKLENEKEAFLYQTVGVFTLFSSFILFLFIRQKHKKDKLKEIYNTETRISQKVHDEVANDVYNVINHIQNGKTVQQATILNQLDDIYKKTRDISYENSIINLESDHYLLELQDMLYTYQNEDVKVTLIGCEKSVFETLNDSKKINIIRVLQELMTNMKKHSKAKNVVFKFKKDKKNMAIIYADDGIGIKKIDDFKKNGLQNAENRIKNINGSFNLDFNKAKGTAISISIPL